MRAMKVYAIAAFIARVALIGSVFFTLHMLDVIISRMNEIEDQINLLKMHVNYLEVEITKSGNE